MIYLECFLHFQQLAYRNFPWVGQLCLAAGRWLVVLKCTSLHNSLQVSLRKCLFYFFFSREYSAVIFCCIFRSERKLNLRLPKEVFGGNEERMSAFQVLMEKFNEGNMQKIKASRTFLLISVNSRRSCVVVGFKKEKLLSQWIEVQEPQEAPNVGWETFIKTNVSMETLLNSLLQIWSFG